MAYEGQIAGVGDERRRAGRCEAPRSAGCSRASEREIRERLPRIVAAVREATPGGLEFVNGGGTGSLARTAAAGDGDRAHRGLGLLRARSCSTTTARSSSTPAAFFVLPVVRRPAPGTATALGGGYLASGAGGHGRAAPALPASRPAPRRPGGRGRGADAARRAWPRAALRIGDRVYMRHAKAGELCERFDSLYLVEGDRIVDEVPTYRGEGKAFL